MPRIPTGSAPETGLNVPQSADIIPYAPLPDIGAAISGLAPRFAEVAGKLTQQQGELEAVNMAADYEAGIKAIRQTLDHDPTTQESPDAYVKMFADKTNELHKEILGRAKSKDGPILYGNYIRRKYPMDLVEAQGQGLKLFKEVQVAILDNTENRMANEAVLAPTPKAAKVIVDAYDEIIKNASELGTITPAEAIKRQNAFTVKIQEGMMGHLAKTDPLRLQELAQKGIFNAVDAVRQASILEASNKAQAHKANQLQQEEDKRAQEYYYGLLGLANDAQVSQTIIDNGLRGHDPIIRDPTKWANIKKIQENAPNGEGNKEVALIASDYEHGEISIDNANQAKARLAKLVENNGAPIPAATKLASRLNDDILRMRGIEASQRGEQRAVAGQVRAEDSAARAREGAERRRIADEVLRARTDYDAQVGPMPQWDLMGQEKKRRDAERNEIENRIRNKGENPSEVVKSIIQRRGVRKQTVPNSSPEAPGVPRTKKDEVLEELLKGL